MLALEQALRRELVALPCSPSHITPLTVCSAHQKPLLPAYVIGESCDDWPVRALQESIAAVNEYAEYGILEGTGDTTRAREAAR